MATATVQGTIACRPTTTVSTEIDDLTLAQQAAGGDHESFTLLYERHHKRILKLCWRMIKNSTEAEDIEQEVWVSVVRNIYQFQGRSQFSTWLNRIAVNVLLMHKRKKEVLRSAIDIEELTDHRKELTDHRPQSILERIFIARGFQKACEALANLDDPFRTIFTLHNIQGLQISEVATLLGKTLGTVKSTDCRARKKLQEVLLIKDIKY